MDGEAKLVVKLIGRLKTPIQKEFEMFDICTFEDNCLKVKLAEANYS
jgi:hypothetical protein